MSIVCFGEILLRLSPPNGHRFGQTTTFEAVFGGSEANVAVALAYWGASSSFISRVPNNDLGMAAIGALSRYGVQTQHVSFGGERLGIYFLEQGMGRRAGKVIYDRKHSGMDTLEPGQIDWEKAFEKATWFHWSGITAALSASAASVLEEALTIASKRQITISCDLNYRETLWKYGKTPQMVMPGLVAHCHVLLGDPTSFDVCLNVR
ncbi:MAG: sugar kinase, partial [Saprospiraceae bacterium]|nr:sugar kinase [Saprospiraceae bacterium]